MSIEGLSNEEIKKMEAERAARMAGYNDKEQVEHHGSVENLSNDEIESMEAERAARMAGYNDKEQVEHHGSLESLSNDEIESMEAERVARMAGYNDKEQVEHHGSVESLSNDEIESMEAEIRARRSEVKHTEQHYGSIENLDEAGIRSMEAQVAEKRKQDIPYKEYFNNLINNPEISDQIEFSDAVLKSMQSNGVMREFIDRLYDKIGEKTFELKNTDKNDNDKIQGIKQNIEKAVAVYQRYIYALKENRWDFSNLHEMKIPEDLKENLWQQQKRLDIIFEMPIPADLGEYYGGKFERNGKMIPGLELIYQELEGKKVNWHQVMIYKENELTPQQRYKQRLMGEITTQEIGKATINTPTTAKVEAHQVENRENTKDNVREGEEVRDDK